MPDNIQNIIAPQALTDLDTAVTKIGAIVTEVNALAQATQAVKFNIKADNLLTFAEGMKTASAALNQTKTAIDGIKSATAEADALAQRHGESVRRAALAEVEHASAMQKSETVLNTYGKHSKEYIAILKGIEQAEKTAAQAATEAAKQKQNAAKITTETVKQLNETNLAAAKITTETAKQLRILNADQIAAAKEADRLAAAQARSAAAAQKAQSPYAQLSKQYRDAQAAAKDLSVTFVLLEQQMIQAKAAGNTGLVAQLKQQMAALLPQVQQAVNKAAELDVQLKKVDGSVGQFQRNVGNYAGAISGWFNNLKAQFQSFMGMMVGFYAILSKIREAIHVNAELSDSFADLKIRIHGTNADVATLVESLKKLDTRTSLTQLVDIAAIIAKKGVAKEEIAGVTKAVDDLMIALGREIGDPHEAVSSLVKLSTIYNDDKHVTADKINAIGNAIQKLTTSGVATGPFLIEFAEQMGGIRGITGMTIDKVLGLGAALEELGQRSSVSSTALSQVVVKLFTEQQKYADLTGKSLGQFKQMLHDDVLGTLVQVAQALKGNAGEMEHFFEGMADMHAKGQRAVGVIGDLAANVGYANKRMGEATKAMHENGNVTAAAAEKQHTFAAELDRVKKAFEVSVQGQEFTNTLSAIAKGLAVLIKALPTLIELGKVWLAGWVLINRAMILNAIVTRASAVAAGVWAFAVGSATAVGQIYAATMAMLTRQTVAATAATTVFSTVLRASPIGWLLTLIGLTAAALVYFANSARAATNELVLQSKAMKLQTELLDKAREATVDTEAQIRVLIGVMKDEKAGLDAKNKALKDLIALSPEYLSGLTLENVATEKGTKLITEYVAALRLKAAYEAAQAMQKEQIGQIAKLDYMEQNLTRKRSSGEPLSEGELEKAPAAKYMPFAKETQKGREYIIDKAIEQIKAERKKLEAELDVTEALVRKKYIALLKPTSEGGGAAGGGTDGRDPNRRVLADIQADIDAQEKLRDSTNATDERHAQALRKLILLHKELAAYMGEQNGGGRRNGLSELSPELKGEKEYAEARASLTKQRLLQEVETNREIMDDDKRTLQERLDANIRFQNAKVELSINEFNKQKAIEDIAINESKRKIADFEARKAELRAGKGNLSGAQRRKAIGDLDLRIGDENALQSAAGTRMVAAFEAEQNAFMAIRAQGQEKNLLLLKNAHQKELQQHELTFAEQKSIELQGLMAQEQLLKDSLERGEITRNDYNRRVKELQEKENRAILLAEVDHWEGMLKVTGLSVEEQINYTEKLYQARKRLSDSEGGAVKKERKEIDPLKQLGGFIFDATYKPQNGETEEQILARKLKYQQDFKTQSILLAKEMYDAINQMRNNAFAAEQQQLQIKSNRIKFESEQKIAAINATTDFQVNKENQLAQLNAQTAAKQLEIQQQERELSIRKAKADKEAAEMNIIMQTAVGIVTALAEYGYAGIPLAALIAATGAVQYSVAASAPIPQYKYGTDATTTPTFIAGDGGEHELIAPPGKKPYWSSDKATVYNEPVGTAIIPLHKLTQQAAAWVSTPTGGADYHGAKNKAEREMSTRVLADVLGRKFGEVGDDIVYALLRSGNRPVQVTAKVNLTNTLQKA